MENYQADFGVVSGPQAAALWSELAAAAKLPPNVGGAELGRALDSMSAAAIARALVPLLEVLRMDGEGGEYRAELAELLLALPQAALGRALQELDIPDRRRAIDTATQVLRAAALVPLLTAAATAYEQMVSDRFGSLLGRLAALAASGEGAVGERANADFRALVRNLNNRWATSLLYNSTTGADVLYSEEVVEATQSTQAPAGSRVLQLALETGAVGPMVWVALRSMTESEEGIRGLLDLLKTAEPTLASQVIGEQLGTPTRLVLLLREQPIDWAAADTVITALGAQAARPLVEQLILADARAVRRAIMDRLVQLGPEIRPVLLHYLGDDRWFVVRNMVVLLREAGCYMEPVVGDNLATHPEPRVRREALLLRLERRESRERAISDALRDSDKQVLRSALHAAGSNLPLGAVLVLARRLAEPSFPAELRTLALGLLGRSDAPASLEALLRVVAGGRTLLGRTTLAPKSPELMAALSGLARSWPDDSRARDFLRLASRSGDPELLAAIRSPASRETA